MSNNIYTWRLNDKWYYDWRKRNTFYSLNASMWTGLCCICKYFWAVTARRSKIESMWMILSTFREPITVQLRVRMQRFRLRSFVIFKVIWLFCYHRYYEFHILNSDQSEYSLSLWSDTKTKMIFFFSDWKKNVLPFMRRQRAAHFAVF